MECNCVRKITEGLLRKYSSLWQHKCERPRTVLKILYTLAGGPLNFDTLGKSGTGENTPYLPFGDTLNSHVDSISKNLHQYQTICLRQVVNEFLVIGEC